MGENTNRHFQKVGSSSSRGTDWIKTDSILPACQWIVRHLPHVIIPTSNYEFAIFIPLADQYLNNNCNHGRHEYRNRTFASHFRLSSH